MVYLQVENCNQRFGRLEVLKKNKWEDPDLSVIKEKKIRKTNAMVSKNKSKKRINSAISIMLKEARKNLKNEIKENSVGTPHKNTWIVSMIIKVYVKQRDYNLIIDYTEIL